MLVPLASRWFLFTVKVVLVFRASGIIGVKYSVSQKRLKEEKRCWQQWKYIT